MSEERVRRMKAAILEEPNTRFVVEEVELLEPLAGQVLVKMVATGLCHTDLNLAKGFMPMPTPCVGGHEGAGIVEEVGPGVTGVEPGDHVVIQMVLGCGKCERCVEGKPYACETFMMPAWTGALADGTTRLRRPDGRPLVHFILQSSFAEYAVVTERQLIKIRKDAPLEVAAFLACGAMTGIGSVINRAKVKPGSKVAVFGCGGVGLSAVMAANLVGASRIIAIDVLENKLEMAKELGATDVIDASKENPVEKIGQLLEGKGVDYSFEVAGKPELMTQAVQILDKEGTAVNVGAVIPLDAQLTVPLLLVHMGRTITGTTGGDVRPQVDIPRYLDLYMAGKLPLDKLLTRTYKLEEINKATEDFENGKLIRAAIVF